jgi:hypothetical protein
MDDRLSLMRVDEFEAGGRRQCVKTSATWHLSRYWNGPIETHMSGWRVLRIFFSAFLATGRYARRSARPAYGMLASKTKTEIRLPSSCRTPGSGKGRISSTLEGISRHLRPGLPPITKAE